MRGLCSDLPERRCRLQVGGRVGFLHRPDPPVVRLRRPETGSLSDHKLLEFIFYRLRTAGPQRRLFAKERSLSGGLANAAEVRFSIDHAIGQAYSRQLGGLRRR